MPWMAGFALALGRFPGLRHAFFHLLRAAVRRDLMKAQRGNRRCSNTIRPKVRENRRRDGLPKGWDVAPERGLTSTSTQTIRLDVVVGGRAVERRRAAKRPEPAICVTRTKVFGDSASPRPIAGTDPAGQIQPPRSDRPWRGVGPTP